MWTNIGQTLKCKICGGELNEIKVSTVQRHMETRRHKRKLQRLDDNPREKKKSRNDLNNGFCQFLMENDMLSKADELIEYFIHWERDELSSIVNGETLRKNYVPQVYLNIIM